MILRARVQVRVSYISANFIISRSSRRITTFAWSRRSWNGVISFSAFKTLCSFFRGFARDALWIVTSIRVYTKFVSRTSLSRSNTYARIAICLFWVTSLPTRVALSALECVFSSAALRIVARIGVCTISSMIVFWTGISRNTCAWNVGLLIRVASFPACVTLSTFCLAFTSVAFNIEADDLFLAKVTGRRTTIAILAITWSLTIGKCVTSFVTVVTWILRLVYATAALRIDSRCIWHTRVPGAVCTIIALFTISPRHIIISRSIINRIACFHAIETSSIFVHTITLTTLLIKAVTIANNKIFLAANLRIRTTGIACSTKARKEKTERCSCKRVECKATIVTLHIFGITVTIGTFRVKTLAVASRLLTRLTNVWTGETICTCSWISILRWVAQGPTLCTLSTL